MPRTLFFLFLGLLSLILVIVVVVILVFRKPKAKKTAYTKIGFRPQTP